jgi:hypothetical protein
MVTVVVDRAAGLATRYINDGVGYGVSTEANFNNTAPIRIGQALSGDYPFKGQIDDLRIYNGLLTAQEVSALYTGGSPSTSTPTNTPTNTPTSTQVGGSSNTPPTISIIPRVNLAWPEFVGPLTFTVDDRETNPANLTVSATSSNQQLLSDSAITLGGSGTNRTLTLHPAAGQRGSATVTLTISDGTLSTRGLLRLDVATSSASADIGFRPSQHGYRFANIGAQTQGELPASILLVQMFGNEAVCIPGTMDQVGACKLDVHVQQMIQGLGSRTYGRAYGMAVTALRFYKNLDYPYSFRSSVEGRAPTIADLTGDHVRTHITRYNLQHLSQPDNGAGSWLFNLSTTRALSKLRQGLEPGDQSDPYLLLLAGAGSATSHTLLPYRVAELGANRYDVFVYDPNFPLDDTRAVQFDLNTGSWSYATIPGGQGPTVDLSGSDLRGSIQLRSLSSHQWGDLRFLNRSLPQPNGLALMSAEQPMMLMTENCITVGGTAGAASNCGDAPPEQQLGCVQLADGVAPNDRGISQICSALPATDNLNLTVYPPQSATTASLANASSDAGGDPGLLPATVGAPYRGIDLTLLTSGGNVAGLHAEQVEATPGGTLKLTMSADARSFTLVPQGITLAPELSFALRGATAAQPSYRIEVAATQLAPGQAIAVGVDETTGRLALESEAGVLFTVAIERQLPDGTSATFVARNLDLSGAPAYADFGAWQPGGTLNLVVDANGNGFGDDVPTQVQSLRSVISLPLTMR